MLINNQYYNFVEHELLIGSGCIGCIINYTVLKMYSFY